ncbi:hypothetical protein V8E36_006492 [Tilletia maclaganii]
MRAIEPTRHAGQATRPGQRPPARSLWTCRCWTLWRQRCHARRMARDQRHSSLGRRLGLDLAMVYDASIMRTLHSFISSNSQAEAQRAAFEHSFRSGAPVSAAPAPALPTAGIPPAWAQDFLKTGLQQPASQTPQSPMTAAANPLQRPADSAQHSSPMGAMQWRCFHAGTPCRRLERDERDEGRRRQSTREFVAGAGA